MAIVITNNVPLSLYCRRYRNINALIKITPYSMGNALRVKGLSFAAYDRDPKLSREFGQISETYLGFDLRSLYIKYPCYRLNHEAKYNKLDA